MAKQTDDEEWSRDFGLSQATRLVVNFLTLASNRGDKLTAEEARFDRTWTYRSIIARNGLLAIPERGWRLAKLIEEFDAIEAWKTSAVLRRLLDCFPDKKEFEDIDQSWDFLESIDENVLKELFSEFCDGSREFDIALVKLWWRDSRKHFPHVP